jgi:diguanylate cyclase (GGDEF)-like protein/PAS domain S-box-containing protein
MRAGGRRPRRRRASGVRVKLLVLEDCAADAALLERALRSECAHAQVVVARDRAALVAALDESPDAILADYTMPDTGALDCLELLAARGLDTPVIVVSGTHAPEVVAECLRRGAADYLFKDRLARLGAAVAAALERRRIARALAEGDEALRRAQKLARLAHAVTGPDGAIESWSETLPWLLGLAPQRLPKTAREGLELVHPEDRAQVRAAMIEAGRRAAGTALEYRARNAEGGWLHLRHVIEPLEVVGAGVRRWFSALQDVTEQKRLAGELERLRRAIDLSPDAVYLTDSERLRFLYVNEAACRRLGYGREELLRLGPVPVLGTSEEEVRRDYAQVIAAGEAGVRLERHFVGSDGTERWSELHRRALAAEGGHVIVTIARDITERKLQERRIEQLSRTRVVTSLINAAIVRTREREALMREVCRAAVQTGGYGAAQVLWVNEERQEIRPGPQAGKHALGFGYGIARQALLRRAPVVASDLAAGPQAGPDAAEAARLGFRTAIALPLTAEGRVAAVLLFYLEEARSVDAEEELLLEELAGDVSFALDSIAKSEQATYLAYYDPLTGLANRTLFLDRSQQALQRAGQAGSKSALVLADIERLSSINGSLGRQAGDAVVRELAARLARAADPAHVGRVGDGQFAVLLPSVKGRSEVGRRLDSLLHQCLHPSFSLGGGELRLAVKSGVALYPADGADAETLLASAEAALRKAKELRESRYFYHRGLTERVAERLALENRLRRALEREEFVLHYQPKVDTATRRIVGLEALIRWRDPDSGLVPPGRFIPLMEETGLILEVGSWALTQAVSDHLRWLGMGLPAPRVAVNVSAIQLRQREFVATVEQALAHGARPPGLDLEITESLIMEDVEAAIARLTELRRLGVGIAIDDFGTGYSSLGYLAKLPVQALKIDRSFIVAMPEDADAMLLVQTVISLAHSLRLTVIAEGVDSEEQARFLRLLRCDEMQGYLVGRPVPFDELTRLLAAESRR